MKNRFIEKWTRKEVNWHETIPHHYHVSQIGINQDREKPWSHYGPCLRQAFYQIKDPIEKSDSSKGNLFEGTMHHEKLQEITKNNEPWSLIEFPLYVEFEPDGRKISASGSIDIVMFEKSTFPLQCKIIDIKTASEYTLPKNEDDKNPTYFAQLKLYAHLLKTFIFGDFVQITGLEIWYINKHNCATYVIEEEFNPIENKEAFDDFVYRCYKLDMALEQDLLPEKEPMKWCKYCDYRMRCESDCLTDDDVKTYTEKEIQELYLEKTGKSYLWRGNETKAYQQFKEGFKIE